MDEVTADRIRAFISKRRALGLKVSRINRQIEVLRRMFALATEWGKLNGNAPKVEMLSGESHRERVLRHDEESRYLDAAAQLHVRSRESAGGRSLFFRKAHEARHREHPPNVVERLEEPRAKAKNMWVFPAPTRSSHIEKSTLKKQYKHACKLANLEEFTLYTFRRRLCSPPSNVLAR